MNLEVLIQTAEALGLTKNDLDTAKEFLFHREYGLCFDTIITQLHENDIQVDANTYTIIAEAAKRLKLPQQDYSFLDMTKK